MDEPGDGNVSNKHKQDEEKDKKEDPLKRPRTPLEMTVELARRGVREILPRLRQMLDEHPELVKQYGDLAKRTEQAWLALFGPDLFTQETTARQLEARRQELADGKPSPLERLVIERVVACLLQVLYFDSREAVGQGVESPEMAAFRLKRQAQANKQLLAAVKSLSELRKVTPPPVVIQILAEESSESRSNGSSRCPGEQAKAVNHRPAPANGSHRNRIAALMGADEAVGVG